MLLPTNCQAFLPVYWEITMRRRKRFVEAVLCNRDRWHRVESNHRSGKDAEVRADV